MQLPNSLVLKGEISGILQVCSRGKKEMLKCLESTRVVEINLNWSSAERVADQFPLCPKKFSQHSKCALTNNCPS